MAERMVAPLTMLLFGPFHVLCEGYPLPKLRSIKGYWLLASLTLQHGKAIPRIQLAERLWPEDDNAERNLYTSVFDLRKALGAEARRFPKGGPSLCLDLTGANVDVIAFDSAIQRGDLDSLHKAVSLYKGPLLEGWAEPWIVQEREERMKHYVTALETLANFAVADNAHDYAVEYLRKAVLVEMVQEQTYRWLMEILEVKGDYNGAMKVYADLTQRLKAVSTGNHPDNATMALVQRIRDRTRQKVTLSARTPSRDVIPLSCTIPRPLTTLLGRSQELQAIIASLLSARLVTLVGIGGVGKTRLATEVALAIADNFTDSAHLVSLDSLSDPELIPQHVAKTMNVAGQPERSWIDALLEFLRQRHLLLVLDNCEHLIDGCADFARKLLGGCPGIRILSTSRERLGLMGEVIRNVLPLALPNAQAVTDLYQCRDNAAVRLFYERAVAVRADFDLADDDVAVVVRICRRLDGLPLAIELAAVLVEMLPVQGIAGRLEDRFRLLRIGDRTAPKRHQALDTMLNWSYDRLSLPEQILLCRLCVFAGGWTLEAAEALNPTSQNKSDTTFMLLSRLVSKSLVLARENRGDIRYEMLETLRVYGRERQNDTNVWEQIRHAHCEYYLRMAEAAEGELIGSNQGMWLARLDQEHDNLRAALTWAAGTGGKPEYALRIGAALYRFWYMKGYVSEGHGWLKCLMDMFGEQPAALRYKVILAQGNLNYARGVLAEARQCFTRCLILAQSMEDRQAQASALASLANVETAEGNYSRARERFIESLPLFEGLRGQALTLSNLAMAYTGEQNYGKARECHERGLALFRQLGASYNIAQECNNLAATLLALGEIASSRPYLEESLALSHTLTSLPLLVACLGNYRSLAVIEEDWVRAATLMGAEKAMREQIDLPLPEAMMVEQQQEEHLVRHGLGDTVFEAYHTQGRQMVADEASLYAMLRDG
jgi:predicted ATPase/DNA-binding SARP family transcriptional activator